MSKQPESYYNIDKLHVIFAILVFGLLAAMGAMFMNDYSRKWKGYQYEFLGLEMEKTRVKYDEAINELKDNPEYTQMLTDLKNAQEAFVKNCGGLNKVEEELKNLETENSLVVQKLKFINADLDVSRYKYETLKSYGSGDYKIAKKNFDSLNKESQELKLKGEKLFLKINARRSTIAECGQEVTQLERQQRKLSKEVTLLEQKLETVDPAKRSMINNIANVIRDLPILDLSNPSVRINQIVLKDITNDRHINQVPKVDRCMTCHLGIMNSDYQDAEQPFKTHPNLELYLNNDSSHPVEEFGCTVCHAGRGRGTSFVSAVHTPSTEKQKKEWEKKYDWKANPHWEEPMLPKQHTQASCLKCHSGEVAIKGAEKLNVGLALIERAGCYGCHTIKKFENWPKSGPDLNKIAKKSSKEWLYKWIKNPHSFNADTWMPSYFNQSNNNDVESHAREEQEVHAMVSFLTQNSEDFSMSSIPVKGDKVKGKELVASTGCMACHEVGKIKTQEVTRDALRRQHGPNLSGLGSKTSAQWIYNWLKKPDTYHAKTRMPNMRLSDQEAADIAVYLTDDKNKEFDAVKIPEVDEKGVYDITLEFMRKIDGTHTAQLKMFMMSLDEKMVFSGQKLISKYGCYSCHDIKGFETAKPIGVELTETGSKDIHKFDFGFVHGDHTKQAWFAKKLKNPRIFDEGKVKKPSSRLLMPNFNLNEEEIEAITTALLGFVKEKTIIKKHKPRTPKNLSIEAGQKLIRQKNCQSCHIIEGAGGSIQKSVKDWLINYDNRAANEADSMVTSFSPPNLIGEGKKVQTQWLFDFLHEPTDIRPWLKVRMPTYTMDAKELNTFVKYFNDLDDEEFPFTEKVDLSLTKYEHEAAVKLFSKDYYGCAQCHIVGDQMPEGSPENWAPDFSLSGKRLKPDWLIDWIMNPSALLPGTKMPMYFDPEYFDESGPDDILDGNEHEQIRVLRNYLMTITEHPPKKESPAVAPAQ